MLYRISSIFVSQFSSSVGKVKYENRSMKTKLGNQSTNTEVQKLEYRNKSRKKCLVPYWLITMCCKQSVDCLQAMWELGTGTPDSS